MARLCRLLGVALVASVASLRRLEGECVDDPDWYYSDKPGKNCDFVGGKVKDDGSLARCKESNTDGKRSALEACPATCGTCGKAPTPQPTAEATAKPGAMILLATARARLFFRFVGVKCR